MHSQQVWEGLVVILSLALLTALFGQRDALPDPVRGLLAILAAGAILLGLWQLSAAP